MHADEIVTSPSDVARLVAEQRPEWADLPVRPVTDFGTDHCLFRLGDDLCVRMPRVGWAADQAVSDDRWLRALAPHLPLEVPVPLALGEPAGDYPWSWSVVPWLPGSPPVAYEPANAAWVDELAGFVRALRDAPVDGGPLAAPGARGSALHHWDESVRAAIAECGDRIDRAAVTAAWDDAVSAPTHDGPPCWLHGDLMAGNLLVRDGALSGVIDFGALAVGDPAPDLLPAWCVLPAGAREQYRNALDVDDATWRRGRGWALGPALTGIPYYWHSVPAFAERGLRTVAVILEDLSSGS